MKPDPKLSENTLPIIISLLPAQLGFMLSIIEKVYQLLGFRLENLADKSTLSILPLPSGIYCTEAFIYKSSLTAQLAIGMIGAIVSVSGFHTVKTNVSDCVTEKVSL